MLLCRICSCPLAVCSSRREGDKSERKGNAETILYCPLVRKQLLFILNTVESHLSQCLYLFSIAKRICWSLFARCFDTVLFSQGSHQQWRKNLYPYPRGEGVRVTPNISPPSYLPTLHLSPLVKHPCCPMSCDYFSPALSSTPECESQVRIILLGSAGIKNSVYLRPPLLVSALTLFLFFLLQFW